MKKKIFGENIFTCPKCEGEMGKQLIKGVVIDKCPSCYSIFLDLGELERIDDKTLKEKIENFILELKNAVG